MNEQLIVKNFGPIKDATVDFKKVTVFIGPTGGGKSTLAKLAAVFRKSDFINLIDSEATIEQILSEYELEDYLKRSNLYIEWNNNGTIFEFSNRKRNSNPINGIKELITNVYENPFHKDIIENFSELIKKSKYKDIANELIDKKEEIIRNYIVERLKEELYKSSAEYIPAERILLSTIGNSWAGIIRDDINLPKALVNFANTYAKARKEIKKLKLDFLSLSYLRLNEHDYISIKNKKINIPLEKAASGIQSTIPLILIIEYFSRQKNKQRNFVIEEPELNLYPSTQQGLLNWIISKCSSNSNDIIMTTHSPYILSHLNLLLYAYQVAEKHPDRAEDVAKIVPRASWINPQEFACYQVENGGVQSLVNAELGLIDNNELDALSGDAADAFDNLIRLSKGVAVR
ncbi:AAA family ATPase [Hymenobacter guriensis]|uniref:AAA family ATPase n=1 Tax=Hymenobacter guriensis TaxID=2793065 RepID=A0ABS0L080_9BACT|nr:AAA family ATPase [Hymenobacter guriensis]MBG8552988.1 AAA family ATPase [Hymenobacter guriensis]